MAKFIRAHLPSSFSIFILFYVNCFNLGSIQYKIKQIFELLFVILKEIEIIVSDRNNEKSWSKIEYVMIIFINKIYLLQI